MTSGEVTYGQMTFGRLDRKPPKKFRTGEKSMGGGEQGSSSESAACERTRRGISSLKWEWRIKNKSEWLKTLVWLHA